MVLLLALIACAPDTETACREGTSLGNDGHCWPDDLEVRPTVQEALGRCVPASDNGAIDIATACASGACARASYASWVTALGDEHACVTTTFDAKQLYCTWPKLGIDGLFPDSNQDRRPDDTGTAARVRLFPPNAVGTVDGLGLGANVACFVEVLGPPDEITFVDVGGQLRAESALWPEYGVSAYDFGDDDLSGRPDGRVDNLYLSGP